MLARKIKTKAHIIHIWKHRNKLANYVTTCKDIAMKYKLMFLWTWISKSNLYEDFKLFSLVACAKEINESVWV